MKQQRALEILKSGKNVFITGSAGTGKTYLLNRYTRYLQERRIYATIVAPTGIAASHLGGQTIHSFFALGIREGIDEYYVESLLEKKYLKSRFSKLKLLIIDEISMVSPELFAAMDLVLRGFKSSSLPFGGVQVVISGDFFQLPPVSKMPKEKRFAWQAEAWRALELETCYLQEKFRQDDDRLISILDDIRLGEISAHSQSLLDGRLDITLAEDMHATRLYTHNVDVDRINLEALAALEGEEKHFEYESKGTQKNIEKIFKTSLVLEKLSLKKDALVIFIKNNAEEGYVNGTTGIVESFSPIDNMPIVRTSQGKKIKLDLEDWSIENEGGKAIASVSQVPLRLAWAITIHKSQGMTLDAAEIDLSKTFETGQGYVALSRIRSIEGLRLMGLNTMALRVDPLILHVDGRIKEASLKASAKIEALDAEALEQCFEAHISRLGGVVNKAMIEEEQANIKAGKPSHSMHVTPTHHKTKNLIAKSDTLIALAQNRGVAKGTILNHLILIKEENPEIALDKYKPAEALVQSVATAVEKLMQGNAQADFTEEGRLKLKVVFDALSGEISYDEIKICLLFVDVSQSQR